MRGRRPLVELLMEFGQEDFSVEQFVKKYPDPVFITLTKLTKTDHQGYDTRKTVSGLSSREVMNPWKDISVHAIGDYGTHPFKGTFYAIGRSDTNDIVLADDSVSHLQALVSHDKTADCWYLKDSSSTNGSFVSESGVEKRIEGEQRHPLKDGAIVRFGNATFTFYQPSAFYAYLQIQKKIFTSTGNLPGS